MAKQKFLNEQYRVKKTLQPQKKSKEKQKKKRTFLQLRCDG